MKKIDISIIIGNILDKFDISLYGFLAPLLGPLFFPGYDSVMQLILTYATSLTSLLARPCGTFLFGMYAYYYGPLYALSYSLMGVACTTIMIGCIPGYENIGWYAPLSLVCVRLLRGICSAGESIVAKLYIMENKKDDDALYSSYIYQSSSMMGIITASAVSTVVINTYPWAWRYCFLLGGCITIIAWCMRVNVCFLPFALSLSKGYTNIFLKKNLTVRLTLRQAQGERLGSSIVNIGVKQDNIRSFEYKNKFYDSIYLIWKEKANLMRVALVTIFSHITYAIPFVFMNNFVPLVTDISLSTMMRWNTGLLVFDMVMIPYVGYASQKFKVRFVLLCANVVLGCTLIPLFYYLSGASLWYVLCVRIWIILWGVVFLCPLNFWCKNLFKSSERYFLIGMGNALGTATLGHLTTPLCLWLWYATGYVYAPALYIIIIILLVIYAIITSQK